MTDTNVHATCTVGEIFRMAIARHPDREALVCRGRRYSYRAMGEEISKFTQALAARGVGRGDAVAMLTANRAEAVFVQAALAHLGARLSWLHPLGSVADHQFIIEDAEITTLIVDADGYAEKGFAVAQAAPDMRCLSFGPAGGADTEGAEDLSALAAGFAPAPLTDLGDPDDIAYILYTGGTTGRPKGVVHRHTSFVSSYLIALHGWDWPAEARTLAATPISHAAGALIPPTFLLGGTVHLLAGFNPEEYLATIAREKITVGFLVPTMIYVLLDHPALAQTDVSSLQTMLYGAAPMSPTRLKEAMARFGPVFTQAYGQTEVTAMGCSLRQSDHDPDDPEPLASCGRPMPGNLVRILDEDLNEVPRGEVGEICFRSPNTMVEYWKRPDETAATLRGGWLHTGDMARMDARGFIYIVDRSKDMIVTGGFNVFPREVEDVLTAHPAVAMAAVIGVPDPKWGEAVMGIVVLRSDATAGEAELIAHVKQAKGSVQTPKSIVFAEALPVTGLGKPDKKALRAQYWKDQDRQVG